MAGKLMMVCAGWQVKYDVREGWQVKDRVCVLAGKLKMVCAAWQVKDAVCWLAS